jgi:hypothetical protein
MILFPTILQAVGIAAIAVSAGLVFTPAGVFVAGVGVLLFGLAWERSGK